MQHYALKGQLMSSPLLTNFLDVARALGEDPLGAIPSNVAAFIKNELKPRGGVFNYNTSIGCLADLFSGKLSEEAAVAFCLENGAPAGRNPNARAIAVVAPYAASHISSCYKIPFTAVPIGRLPNASTAFMGIKAPIVRVENREAMVVVPGFRLGHKPRGIEIDVAASLALATFARDDFAEADYEYLDCSRGVSGERELRSYRGKDRRIFNLDEVDHMLDLFVQGLALAVGEGIAAGVPNFRGYKIFDPDQPRML